MGSVSRRVPSNAFARSGGLRVAREVSRSPNSRVSAAATHSELPEAFNPSSAAKKRLGVVIDAERVISWDHSKLGGGY